MCILGLILVLQNLVGPPAQIHPTDCRMPPNPEFGEFGLQKVRARTRALHSSSSSGTPNPPQSRTFQTPPRHQFLPTPAAALRRSSPGRDRGPSLTTRRAAPSRTSPQQPQELAMDVLKRELQRKRQLLDADFGARKILRRAEIEARELQRIREAERRRLLQKQLRDSHPAASSPPGTYSGSSPASAAADAPPAENGASGQTESLPRDEVIRRLRVLRQPATLFGEDDAARLRRLNDVLEDPTALADVDADEIGEGQTNDFLRDIQALRVKAAAATKPKAGAEAQRREGDGEEREVPFEELCDEDKIAAFFRRLMGEWSQEMDEMPEAERRTAKGKAAVATCKQCARYLDPLFKQCKKKEGVILNPQTQQLMIRLQLVLSVSLLIRLQSSQLPRLLSPRQITAQSNLSCDII
ncbi:hypothetical protein SETIT_9G127100v2 [Setaria italica]|uniref:Pre-mRNA processing factor 4 (PRP4)-like domain-containing protein n=2 Tax=Setaria TaxID=4554 RepID=A0A368SG41_SETIT|nr:hypothetical protein SETIT_9G127100v2 [Setaria italica]TKV91874.1 hypothetical protein SEVIR_9G126100v2 [Setaria viridis]TKV91876.1 hypothetical protein SEVIR_9G126100v2 [Setaria viridis]